MKPIWTAARPLLCAAAAFASLLSVACQQDADDEVGETPEEERELKVPRFYLEEPNSLAGRSTHLVKMPLSQETLTVDREALFTEFDVAAVQLVRVRSGRMALCFVFDEMASRALYRESVESNGKRIVTFINGVPVGIRRFDGAIDDGTFYTFVEMPEDELEELVLDLKHTISMIREKTHKMR